MREGSASVHLLADRCSASGAPCAIRQVTHLRLRDLPHWWADGPLLPSEACRSRVSDLLALLVAVGAVIASLVVWDYGKVDIGMTLGADGELVFVHDVTPDGNAHRSGFRPGISMLDLTTTDGDHVERGEPIGMDEGLGRRRI